LTRGLLVAIVTAIVVLLIIQVVPYRLTTQP
jgi:hypothetical protein